MGRWSVSLENHQSIWRDLNGIVKTLNVESESPYTKIRTLSIAHYIEPLA